MDLQQQMTDTISADLQRLYRFLLENMQLRGEVTSDVWSLIGTPLIYQKSLAGDGLLSSAPKRQERFDRALLDSGLSLYTKERLAKVVEGASLTEQDLADLLPIVDLFWLLCLGEGQANSALRSGLASSIDTITVDSLKHVVSGLEDAEGEFPTNVQEWRSQMCLRRLALVANLAAGNAKEYRRAGKEDQAARLRDLIEGGEFGTVVQETLRKLEESAQEERITFGDLALCYWKSRALIGKLKALDEGLNNVQLTT